MNWSEISKGFKVTVGVILMLASLVGGVIAFEDRYAKTNEVKEWDDSLETKLVATLDKFKSEMVQEGRDRRYISLTDQLMQYKLLIKKNPNDQELKEDYERIYQEREELRKKIQEKK